MHAICVKLYDAMIVHESSLQHSVVFGITTYQFYGSRMNVCVFHDGEDSDILLGDLTYFASAISGHTMCVKLYDDKNIHVSTS